MSASVPPTLSGGAQTTHPVRSLYGGAVTAQIPHGWLDVSDMRQVPSHQECWQDPTSGALLVVEILDYQSSVTNDAAAQYFYEDLAEANGVSETERQFRTLPSNGVTLAGVSPASSSSSSTAICLGKGLQKIQQGKEYDAFGNKRELPEGHWVQIDLGVIRLPQVTTDLLVTLSAPTPSTHQQEIETPQSSLLFQTIFSSIHIIDWSLFGES